MGFSRGIMGYDFPQRFSSEISGWSHSVEEWSSGVLDNTGIAEGLYKGLSRIIDTYDNNGRFTNDPSDWEGGRIHHELYVWQDVWAGGYSFKISSR